MKETKRKSRHDFQCDRLIFRFSEDVEKNIKNVFKKSKTLSKSRQQYTVHSIYIQLTKSERAH